MLIPDTTYLQQKYKHIYSTMILKFQGTYNCWTKHYYKQ